MDRPRCGALTRSGKPCKLAAGHGTSHVGFGHCRRHLGNTRNHEIGAARDQALQFARGALGQELDIDPLEGVLVAVKLSYGIVDYWRHQLAEDEAEARRLHEQFGRAVMDYTRICDIAIKAGVSERQIKILERTADQLSLLFEDIAAAANATAEQRRAMTDAWVKGLAKLEAPVIEGTATDLAA